VIFTALGVVLSSLGKNKNNETIQSGEDRRTPNIETGPAKIVNPP
jgi:hypothetical protein